MFDDEQDHLHHSFTLVMQSIQGIKSGIAEIYQKHVAGKFQLERVEKPRLDDAFLQVATLEVRVCCTVMNGQILR